MADYFAGDILDFSPNVGSVSLFDAGDMRVSPVQGRMLNIPLNTGYMELSFTGASCYMAGKEIMLVGNQNVTDLSVQGGRYHSSNFLSGATPYTHPVTLAPGHVRELLAPGGRVKDQAGSAFVFSAGTKRFRIGGADINRETPGTQQWNAQTGVDLGANCDDYDVSDCAIGGQYVGLGVGANATPSTRRRVSNNRIKGLLEFGTEGALLPALPATGNVLWNSTPFTLSVSLGGGTVTNIEYRVYGGIPQSNRPTGRTNGEFTLQPGEGLLLEYTAAPVYAVRVLT